MTPMKGTREWLKPALVKDRDNCPGAQVSMSSPHSHPQSLTLPWVFQSFPEPFHLITSFIPLFTALHTLTVFRAIVSSPVCLAGLRIKAFTHLFIHSMHQNTHQLAIEAGIFCVCLAVTTFPKSLQRIFPIGENHLELQLETDSQISKEIYWIRISLGNGALWEDPVNLIIWEAQRDGWAFLCHFICRDMLLGVGKVTYAPFFKLCPLLDWNSKSNSDSNGDPWNRQNQSCFLFFVFCFYQLSHQGSPWKRQNPLKAKSQGSRLADMWTAPRDGNRPDQSHCSWGLCLQSPGCGEKCQKAFWHGEETNYIRKRRSSTWS